MPPTIRLTVEPLESRLTPAITMRLDYSFDTSGFFNQPGAKDALERAVNQIVPKIQDNLAAIVPSGGNTWEAVTVNAATQQQVRIPNLVVGQNEMILYLTAGSIGTTEAAIASGGGFQAGGSQAWLNLIRGRGQAGALASPATDFSSWGGMIAFDTGTNWHFGADVPGNSEIDFTTVALHELLHVFGLGLGEPSYTRWMQNSQFTGPNAQTVFNGPLPMADSQGAHVAQGTRFLGQEAIMVPTLMAGEQKVITSLELAFLADIGWQIGDTPVNPPVVPVVPVVPGVPPTSPPVTPPTSPPVVPVVPPAVTTVPPTNTSVPLPIQFTVGIGPVLQATAFGYGASGSPKVYPAPFGANFTGGVRVATVDLNADGILDHIFGTGPGIATRVVAIDGVTGNTLLEFFPFEASFTGGVFVAAGDLTGDGVPEIAVTPDEGGGPRVKIYDGVAGGVVADFFGIDDANFRGGARATIGDLNKDGRADLGIAAGFGGGPRVAIFDGLTVANNAQRRRLVSDFFAFEPELRNGVFLVIADLDNDGFGELIAGAGPGGSPRVTAFSGTALLGGQLNPVANFFAGPETNRGGVRVAAVDLDMNGRPDILTGSGEAGNGSVAVYDGPKLIRGETTTLLFVTDPTWELPGVFVG